MAYLLYPLILVGMIGLIYFLQFKRFKRNIDSYVDMNVEMLTGAEEIGDQSLPSSLLFRLEGLDEHIKELVVTDVNFCETGVNSNSFEKIVFCRHEGLQHIPERSISFSISETILQKRKEVGIPVQIRGYLRDYESKLSKFQVERVVRERKVRQVK